MTGLVVVGALLVGFASGSFANVAIYRWPRGGSVNNPKRSACPSCGTQIRATDNLPVISWLVLRGRCRHCDARISPRYLVVEVLTGLLFAAIAWVWGPALLLPALLVFAWACVVATGIDLEHRRIPNVLTLRLPLVLLPLIVVPAVIEGAWGDLVRALIAAVAIPAAMLALSLAFRAVRGQDGMGMGDVKFAISIGLVVGYLGGLELVVWAYGSIITAVIVAFTLIAMGRAKLASRIPFGPYLAIGALLPILAGEPLTRGIRAYLGLPS